MLTFHGAALPIFYIESTVLGTVLFLYMEIHRIQQSHRQLGQDGKKLSAMVPEPFSVELALWVMPGYQGPKVLAVIHLPQMAQLMDDDIVYNLLRSHNQPPVKVQVLEGGAAAPPGGLVLDKEPVKAKASLVAPIGSPLRDILLSPPAIPLQQWQLDRYQRMRLIEINPKPVFCCQQSYLGLFQAGGQVETQLLTTIREQLPLWQLPLS